MQANAEAVSSTGENSCRRKERHKKSSCITISTAKLANELLAIQAVRLLSVRIAHFELATVPALSSKSQVVAGYSGIHRPGGLLNSDQTLELESPARKPG